MTTVKSKQSSLSTTTCTNNNSSSNGCAKISRANRVPEQSSQATTAVPEATVENNHTTAGCWRIRAATGAIKTNNPIREIIETLDLAPNPNKKLIPLSIGDPTVFGNLKPCSEILDALQKASNSGQYYGYQTAAGLEKARDAVAEYHRQCTGNCVKRQDVILASGCSHAIDLCICVLAERGQNILIPRPGFPLYKTLTSVYGVEYKQYNLIAEQDWAVDLEHLESLVDPKTAAIVINNPSNPCGSVFSREHLLQILDIAERHRLPIIADEIYEKFVFAPEHYGATKQQQLITSPMDAYNNRPNTIAGERRDDEEDPTSCDSENRNPIRSAAATTTRTTVTARRKLSIDSNVSQSTAIKQIDHHFNHKKDPNTSRFLRMNAEPADSGIDLDDNDTSMNDISLSSSTATSPTPPQSVADDSPAATLLHHVPFVSISALSERVPILTCGGISKTCLIPGLRLGWIIINDKQNNFDPTIRSGLSRLTQRLMGPNSLVQGALHDILMNVPETFYKQTMDFIFINAKLCYDRLKLVDGLQPYMPQGSMYLMVRFDAKCYPNIDGDLDFTSKLMNQESVLVLPGRCFDFPNFFRICLTVPTNVMEEAMNRIDEFCRRHYVRNTTNRDKIDHCLDVDIVSHTTTPNPYPSFNINNTSTNNFIVKTDRIHVNSNNKFDRNS